MFWETWTENVAFWFLAPPCSEFLVETPKRAHIVDRKIGKAGERWVGSNRRWRVLPGLQIMSRSSRAYALCSGT